MGRWPSPTIALGLLTWRIGILPIHEWSLAFQRITEPLLDRDQFLHDYEPGSTETALPRASLTNREPIQQQHLLLSQEHRKGTSMKNIVITSLTTGALASAALGLAGNPNAAPSGPLSVNTVSQLRAQGFEVIVNRIGTAPSDQRTVGAVRPGQTFLAHRLRCA